VTEKVKEIAEKEGPVDYASSAFSPKKALENVSFWAKELDVARVASLFCNEKLEELEAMERREAWRQERREERKGEARGKKKE